MDDNTKSLKPETSPADFFDYWEALGFFDNLQITLPPELYIIFDIARLIASEDSQSIAQSALKELLNKNTSQTSHISKNQLINWQERSAPLSEKMEIQNYKTIFDLKKAIPRELMWDRQVFNIKLFTKTLLVRKHFETVTDRFKAISQVKDEKGRNRAGFEQKFYLLLDRSRSMDKQLRSFYSKSLIVEFLRKKLETKAKIFFRAFDSKPGDLVKIENKDDYTSLIEKIIFTTTGGTSTNMQRAIFQAVDDIINDKEIADAEILVVTDCLVHDLNVPAMKEKLKDIKLNILKIGLDLAEPNGYEIEKLLNEAGYKFDPFSVNIKDIKKKLESKNESDPLSRTEHKIYEYMLDCSQKIIKNMKSVSEKFIEIDDIHPTDFTTLNDNTFEIIQNAIRKLSDIDTGKKTIQELAIAYKKAYFLSQYIEFLLNSEKTVNNSLLQQAANELAAIKQKMLNNPYLLNMISGSDTFGNDKKMIKAANRAAKKKFKEMAQTGGKLSREEIKKAELIFSAGTGSSSGNTVSIFIILMIKLWELIKSVLSTASRK